MAMGMSLSIGIGGRRRTISAGERALQRAYFTDETADTYNGTNESTLLPVGAIPASLDVADEFTVLMRIDMGGATPKSFGRFIEGRTAGNIGWSIQTVSTSASVLALLQGASGYRQLSAGTCTFTADGWATIGMVVTGAEVYAWSDTSGRVASTAGNVANRSLVGDATTAEQPRIGRATSVAAAYQGFGYGRLAMWAEALSAQEATDVADFWATA